MCILRLLAMNLKYGEKPVYMRRKRLMALVADTQRKMTVGLMFRKLIGPNKCMLFVFPYEGAHPIWMHNMKFPLDILWLDSDRRIVHIVESAKPTSGLDFSNYASMVPAKYVIELNAGFVRKNKIKINDVARFGA